VCRAAMQKTMILLKCITQNGLPAFRLAQCLIVRPAHHIDEEEELFPILLERVPTAAPRIEQLEAEHGYLHSCWNAIRDDLRALRNGELDSISENAVAEFVRQYREHAASEEAWLIPTAAATLNADELRNAGLRMAQRRQQAC